MTFDETLHVECQSCGKAAQTHRLTAGGNWFCLELNAEGRNRYMAPRFQKTVGVVNLADIVYTCQVRFLKRSPLSKKMGAAITGYLNGQVTLEV